MRGSRGGETERAGLERDHFGRGQQARRREDAESSQQKHLAKTQLCFKLRHTELGGRYGGRRVSIVLDLWICPA